MPWDTPTETPHSLYIHSFGAVLLSKHYKENPKTWNELVIILLQKSEKTAKRTCGDSDTIPTSTEELSDRMMTELWI